MDAKYGNHCGLGANLAKDVLVPALSPPALHVNPLLGYSVKVHP